MTIIVPVVCFPASTGHSLQALLDLAMHFNLSSLLQYIEDGSKAFGTREPDYAGQYSPWSCDTIGSYIGSKDPKPKDAMSAGPVEMMVGDPHHALLLERFSAGVNNCECFSLPLTEYGGKESAWATPGCSAAFCRSQRWRPHHSVRPAAHGVTLRGHFTHLQNRLPDHWPSAGHGLGLQTHDHGR